MILLLLMLFAAFELVFADHHQTSFNQLSSNKPWLGKWQSTGRQENFENFVTALQLSTVHSSINTKVFHELWQVGADHYHHRITVPSTNYENEVEFKLGEERILNLNSTAIKYKYTEENDGLMAVYIYPLRRIIVSEHYKVDGNELLRISQIGNIVAKTWFSRVKS